MVPGLIIYDEENFYGFSEKNGLNLLSQNNDFKELEFPILDKQFQDQKKDLNIDFTFYKPSSTPGNYVCSRSSVNATATTIAKIQGR